LNLQVNELGNCRFEYNVYLRWNRYEVFFYWWFQWTRILLIQELIVGIDVISTKSSGSLNDKPWNRNSIENKWNFCGYFQVIITSPETSYITKEGG
jgi:hypothetical protein